MSGDFSRIGFDPLQDDLGVLLQQGRPLSDADWNALVAQMVRRIHVGTLDAIGTAVVPTHAPDGFKVSLAGGGGIDIGVGRIYVDGLLAENHGTGAFAWDARREEQVGSQPVPYAAQPWYPNAPALPTTGRHLLYLDVWRREVTAIGRPALVDPAVGIDSTARWQTVWQVKFLPNVGTDVGCSTPLEEFAGWLPANAPSAGRLSTSAAEVPGQPNPCLVAPSGGYQGLENQLYRVEIHQGGAPGTATFKWSRENGSVQSRVTHLPALNQLVVESTGKDAVLRFSDGDWVEVTDDWLELNNLPGHLRRIRVGNGVDDNTRTIVLEKPLPLGAFPTDAMHRTQPGRNTRVKRWDQRDEVFDHDGNVLADLGSATSDGTITVPTSATVGVLLEHGVLARFDLAAPGGLFRSGDSWSFEARHVDASVAVLDKAPPHSVHHHYAKLGIVTFPDSITDCRVHWPPPTGAGEGCACTICVSPEQHASGALTIQSALDRVRAAGGGSVCLSVGDYALAGPLLLDGSRSVRLSGQGSSTRLLAAAGAIRIRRGSDIALESFSVVGRGGTAAAATALIAVESVRQLRIEHLQLRLERANGTSAAIELGEAIIDVSIRHCGIGTSIGIRNGARGERGAGIADLRIDENTFECDAAGIHFSSPAVHSRMTRISANRFDGNADAAIVLTGAGTPDAAVEVAHNLITAAGDGIRASMGRMKLHHNQVDGRDGGNAEHAGIVLVEGRDDAGIVDTECVANRVAGFRFAGIRIRADLRGLLCKQNQIVDCGNGIVFEREAVADRIAIDNNQVEARGGFALSAQLRLLGISVLGNRLVGSPRGVVLLGGVAGDIVFADNHSVRAQADGADGPDVLLRAQTVIASSNRMIGGGLSLDVHAGDRHYTIVGNIARGKIVLNGGNGIGAPWTSLNREGI